MSSDLRAFTLHRVWAGMVACGWKPYEYRNARPTACIGQRVAIHAGHNPGPCLTADQVLLRVRCGGLSTDALQAAPAGHIIALATVGEPLDLQAQTLNRAVGVEYAADALRHLPPGYERTRWAIPLLDVRRLTTPIPCRGSVTLGWTVPAEVAARVLEQEVALVAR